MKNILLIMPYGSVGGMERLALNFYNYYKQKGYNVKALKFIGLQTDIINFNDDEFILSNKDLSDLSSFQRLKFYLTIPLKIRKIIKSNHITHSIAFGDFANLFSAITLTGENKIGSIHALKSIEMSTNSHFSKLIKVAYKTVYKKFNKVVCISEAIKKDLIENCGYKFESNLKVIYNPHDKSSILKLSHEPIDDATEKLIFKKDVLIFIGRMSIQKSPWHLINAVSLLKNKTQFNLVFIGDGDKRVENYINQLIQNHNMGNNVFFLGRKSNPYKYLSKSKALVLSSHYEGTPNVIVEALILNIPVVSSNCTNGIAELMSLDTQLKPSHDSIIVEGGIITPNLFKGHIGVPDGIPTIVDSEVKLSEALAEILTNPLHKIKLNETADGLTNKFNINFVCDTYLQ